MPKDAKRCQKMPKGTDSHQDIQAKSIAAYAAYVNFPSQTASSIFQSDTWNHMDQGGESTHSMDAPRLVPSWIWSLVRLPAFGATQTACLLKSAPTTDVSCVNLTRKVL